MQRATPDTVSCLSWNIHRGRGNDGHVDPDRTLSVLRDEVWRAGPDALFLQEADEEVQPYRGVLDVSAIEATTGLSYMHTERVTRSSHVSHGFLGMIAFLHPSFDVEEVRLVDLPGVCPRGAVVLDATRDGRKLRFITTHLSLSQPLRMAQMRTISQHVRRFDERQVILCGDLNEWRPWGGLALSQRLLGHAFKGPAKPTFPIRRPLLALDRVLTTAPGHVEKVEVLDGPGIRMTSDHRPLLAHIRVRS